MQYNIIVELATIACMVGVRGMFIKMAWSYFAITMHSGQGTQKL